MSAARSATVVATELADERRNHRESITALAYWLLRAYQAAHREGWEEGPSVDETMESIVDVLANIGVDPGSPRGAFLLAHPPKRVDPIQDCDVPGGNHLSREVG